MPCGREGKGLHLPPLPESVSLLASAGQAFSRLELGSDRCPKKWKADLMKAHQFWLVMALACVTSASSADLQHKVQLVRSEEHTSELQSRVDLVCRLLLEKKKKKNKCNKVAINE